VGSRSSSSRSVMYLPPFYWFSCPPCAGRWMIVFAKFLHRLVFFGHLANHGDVFDEVVPLHGTSFPFPLRFFYGLPLLSPPAPEVLPLMLVNTLFFPTQPNPFPCFLTLPKTAPPPSSFILSSGSASSGQDPPLLRSASSGIPLLLFFLSCQRMPPSPCSFAVPPLLSSVLPPARPL